MDSLEKGDKLLTTFLKSALKFYKFSRQCFVELKP